MSCFGLSPKFYVAFIGPRAEYKRSMIEKATFER